MADDAQPGCARGGCAVAIALCRIVSRAAWRECHYSSGAGGLADLCGRPAARRIEVPFPPRRSHAAYVLPPASVGVSVSPGCWVRTGDVAGVDAVRCADF